MGRVDEVGGDIEIDVEEDDENHVEALWSCVSSVARALTARIILSEIASYILSVHCLVSTA